jgi:hypothetical protein
MTERAIPLEFTSKDVSTLGPIIGAINTNSMAPAAAVAFGGQRIIASPRLDTVGKAFIMTGDMLFTVIRGELDSMMIVILNSKAHDSSGRASNPKVTGAQWKLAGRRNQPHYPMLLNAKTSKEKAMDLNKEDFQLMTISLVGSARKIFHLPLQGYYEDKTVGGCVTSFIRWLGATTLAQLDKVRVVV